MKRRFCVKKPCCWACAFDKKGTNSKDCVRKRYESFNREVPEEHIDLQFEATQFKSYGYVRDDPMDSELWYDGNSKTEKYPKPDFTE